MVDLVFAEIELPTTGTGWKSAMRQRAISARAALRRHPWAVALMESRRTPVPPTFDTTTPCSDACAGPASRLR
jgi:hypothetical protein